MLCGKVPMDMTNVALRVLNVIARGLPPAVVDLGVEIIGRTGGPAACG